MDPIGFLARREHNRSMAVLGSAKDETASMLAASLGGFEYVKIVRMLLNHGADGRAQDLKGRTAIDIAIGRGVQRRPPS